MVDSKIPEIETGGPAFPTLTERNELREHGYRPVNDLESGMTLRDYFAGQALIGIATSTAGVLPLAAFF